ncbi:MAG: sensor domain-containing diguanylate cyclase [Rhodocyclales bacterium]|nr:sensor domain-containing diguanylate cyclase [Rhodocyclales bacterium]
MAAVLTGLFAAGLAWLVAVTAAHFGQGWALVALIATVGMLFGGLAQVWLGRARGVAEAAVPDSDEARTLCAIARGVHGIEALFDPSGKLLWISPSIAQLTGRAPADYLAAADALALLVHESDLAFCRKALTQVGASGAPEDFEMRFTQTDGGVCWVACHWRRLERGVGPAALRMSAENIQARKETEYTLLETVAELRRSQALREHYLARSNDERLRLTALLDVIRLGILFLDQDSRVVYFNRAILDMWGFGPDENLIGLRNAVLRERVAPLLDETTPCHGPSDHPSGPEQAREIRLADGRVITCASATVAGELDGRAIGRVWIYEDVTAQRQIARRMVDLAERDPLTNLYNRRRFHEELERLLADALRRGFDVGLIILDLDGFKPINDEFGHQAGDEVLTRIARKVGAMVRRNETFFRLGGDEFAVLVPDAGESGLIELARRIVEGVASLEFEFEGKAVSLTVSLGIALFPRHAQEEGTLIGAADQAMYASKSEGRNRWSIACRR